MPNSFIFLLLCPSLSSTEWSWYNWGLHQECFTEAVNNVTNFPARAWCNIWHWRSKYHAHDSEGILWIELECVFPLRNNIKIIQVTGKFRKQHDDQWIELSLIHGHQELYLSTSSSARNMFARICLQRMRRRRSQ